MSFITKQQKDPIQLEYKFADFKTCNNQSNKMYNENSITKAFTNSAETFDKLLADTSLNLSHSDQDENDLEDLMIDRFVFLNQENEPETDNFNPSELKIQVNEDDITDQSNIIKDLFQRNLIEKFECRFDIGMQMFTPYANVHSNAKHAKLSKSLQRKLINFHQLLDQFPMNPQELDLFKELDCKKWTPENVHKLTALINELSKSSNTNDIIKSQKINYFILQSSIQNQEFKKKIFKSMRAIVERVLIDASQLLDQYHHQEQLNYSNNYLNQNGNQTLNLAPTNKLWMEIRKSGCQFLGPQMQEDTLKLILHLLTTVNRMARKTLVLYVVQMLKRHNYPKASKTSVGHVVQLLYKAGCFVVHKRDCDASLMELKKEYTKYTALRRLHDTQIIHIALVAGIRMSPEQWSQKLYGDANQKSYMQSIIDTLQSQQTLESLITDFFNKVTNKKLSDDSPFHSYYHDSFMEQQFSDDSSGISKLNMLFLAIKEDFEFFTTIYVDTFAQKKSNSFPHTDYNGPFDNVSSTESDDERIMTSEDDDDFDSLSNSSESRGKSKLIEQDQTKLLWSLLVECMERMLKILAAHVEYAILLTNVVNNNTNHFNGSQAANQPRNGFHAKTESGNYNKKYGMNKNPKNSSNMLVGGGFDFSANKASLDIKNVFNQGNPYKYEANNGYMMNTVSQPFIPINQQSMGLYNSLGASHMIHPPMLPNNFASNFSDSFFFDQNNNSNDTMNNFHFGTASFQPEFAHKNFKYNDMNGKMHAYNFPFSE